MSAGHVVEPPQVSAGSQGPAEARHTVAAAAGVVMHSCAALQVSIVHGFESWFVHAAPFGRYGPHWPVPS